MHTSAPWWVTDYGVRDRGGYICHTQPPTHFQGQDERFANEVEERKANARLIAAAPELLRMVNDLLDALGDCDSDIENDARALVAKATESAA